MRVSDGRYAKDRRALDVAARLIDFEARTSTIRRLTGLADTRIRSLSKACGVDGQAGAGARVRHRGSSPRRLSNLLGKDPSRSEAAALLAICKLMGVAHASEPGSERGWSRVGRAEGLCDAYWTFRYLLPEASIGFEHMLLLLSEAAKGEDVSTTHCKGCRAFLVVDALSLYRRLCTYCSASPRTYRTADPPQYLCVAEEAPAYV